MGRKCTFGAIHFHEPPDNRARKAADRVLSRVPRPLSRRSRPRSKPSSRASTAAKAPADIAVGGRPASTLPADMFHRTHHAAAMRATDEMRRHGDMLAEVEQSGRKRRQEFIWDGDGLS